MIFAVCAGRLRQGRVALTWGVVLLLATPLVYWSQSSAHYLGHGDPDAWLRLSELRDLVQGGLWHDHVVERDNAPYGVSIHWTRAFDLLLLAFALPLSLFLPLDRALLGAAMAVNPLLLAASMTAMLRLVYRLRPPVLQEAMLLTLGLLISSPYWMGAFAWMRSDHHGLLLLCAALALERFSAGRIGQSALWTAIGIWVSPEALFIACALAGALTLDWALRGERATLSRLAAYLTQTSAFALLAMMAELPFAEWGAYRADAISLAHVALLAFCALAGMLLHRLPDADCRRRAAYGALVLAAALASAALLFPRMLHGPMEGVDPFMFRHFFPHVAELQPGIPRQALWAALSWLPPALACIAAGVFEWGRRKEITLLALVVWLAMAVPLVALQLRWQPYLWLVLAPLAACAVSLALRYGRLRGVLRLSRNWWGMAGLWIVVPVGVLIFSVPPKLAGTPACQASVVAALQDGRLEQALGNAKLTLAVHSDIGPHVLFWTRYAIIGSNYHRNGDGFRDLWLLQQSGDAALVQRIMKRRGVDAWLWCESQRPRIARGGMPPFMRRVPIAQPAQGSGLDRLVLVAPGETS